MMQQAAEIAFFKLKGARSYRFVNLPTVRKLDVQADQILRVTDSRDIAYFRQRPDVMMECDESGKGLNEPTPGTITTPNARTKRQWRSPTAPPVSTLAQPQQQGVPGTMVVGSPHPPAQNPTGQYGVSAYNQHPPGLVNKGQQPTVVPQGARPTVTTGVLGIPSRGAQQPPMAVAPPQQQTALPEVRLGQVMTGGRPHPGSTPLVQPAPVAPQVVAPAPQQASQIDPIVQQALAMHPGAQVAQATDSAPADGRSTASESPEGSEEEGVAADTPQDIPQAGVGTDGQVDPAYLAAPIPEGGLPTPPRAVQPHPTGAAPSIVGQPPIAAPVMSAPGSTPNVLASASARALAQGRGVPDASHAQQILAEMGQAPDPVPESPLERIGSDGRPAGSF